MAIKFLEIKYNLIQNMFDFFFLKIKHKSKRHKNK
jgi:hypothetical protein